MQIASLKLAITDYFVSKWPLTERLAVGLKTIETTGNIYFQSTQQNINE